MDALLASHGYPALFLLSFLAATLLPLGAEWMLAALLLEGFDPALSVGLATLGNTLGALVTYGVGLWGGPVLIEKILRIDAPARERAERFYGRYGTWSLLFSWLPIIGDPLCLAGGVLRVGFGRFLVLVAVGKLARFAAVALLVLKGGRIFA
ncbi:YqaA family protein [uncultured Desulfuromonas sp.]|uniref:YqaA family protein n=1 Tax=uncultured Desulfuromonas sp. TaxID=181013 RepID=UPI0026256608|nr:YqaA family protein [uncultured Desulfuromonas sp.]